MLDDDTQSYDQALSIAAGFMVMAFIAYLAIPGAKTVEASEKGKRREPDR
ncbi:hypothetical protein [Qipengyuania sp. MTN3-11]